MSNSKALEQIFTSNCLPGWLVDSHFLSFTQQLGHFLSNNFIINYLRAKTDQNKWFRERNVKNLNHNCKNFRTSELIRRVSRYEKMPLTAHLAIGWSVFSICLIGSLIFSWLFVLWLRSVRENESSGFTNLIISLCLCITIVSALLVPVDVFLVSSMKNADGSYQVLKGKNKHQSHNSSDTYDQNSLIFNLLDI